MSGRGLIHFSIGLVVLILGIAACAYASQMRDRAGNAEMRIAPGIGSWVGVTLALLAGVVSSMLNIGFAHGKPLVQAAIAAGITPLASGLAVWIPALLGGCAVNSVFALVQIHRSGGLKQFRSAKISTWLRSGSMGVLWFTSILLYGIGSPLLGHTGSVYGWAIDAGASIVTSSTWGFVLGEWKNAEWGAKALLLCGIISIVCAAFVLSQAIAVS
jgi:L-rhamnose-H+ transport protein